MQILGFSEYKQASQRLAERLSVDWVEVYVHHFPDAESLVRLPVDLSEHIVICRSLNQPNDKLIELLLTVKTARESGVKRVTLVAPYLCYMRQDIANQPGEAVSQRIIGQLLADLFDDVITVDPHLHRISRLEQAVPVSNAISLTAGEAIADFLKKRLKQAVLFGPDEESEQWVRAIAEKTGFDYAVAHKLRKGDKNVSITLPDFNFSGRTVVLVDDMASTGRTLAQAAGLVRQAGAVDLYAAITHPLFCGDAEKVIREAGIQEIWSSDSIPHPTACIHLDELLCQAIREII